jgi:hypothetical protein
MVMANLRSIGAAILVAAASAGNGFAQYPQNQVPPGRPTVSPYLNLIRPGTPPAINYFNLVRPQNEFLGSIQQLQQQVGFNRQNIAGLEQGITRSINTLPPTGFIPQFQSHRSYFQNYSGFGALNAAPLNAGRGLVTGSSATQGYTPPPRRR